MTSIEAFWLLDNVFNCIIESNIKSASKEGEEEEQVSVSESKKDKKFFSLMNQLLQNGTVPKKMKSVKRGSNWLLDQTEKVDTPKPKPSVISPLKITFKGILEKVLEHKRKYGTYFPLKG